MPHFVQALRDVGGHIIGRDNETIPTDHVVRADNRKHASKLVGTGHFVHRGEHDSTPPALSDPGNVEDTTVYSDQEAQAPPNTPSRLGEEGSNVITDEEAGEDEVSHEYDQVDPEDEVNQFAPDGNTSDSINTVEGVGRQREEDLHDLGIETVGQLAEAGDNDDVPDYLVENARERLGLTE